MAILLHKINQIPQKQNIAYVLKSADEIKLTGFPKNEADYIKKEFKGDKIKLLRINRLGYWVLVSIIPDKAHKDQFSKLEAYRKQGLKISKLLQSANETKISFFADNLSKELTLAVTEGIILSSYRFNKYKQKNKQSNIEKVNVLNKQVTSKDLKELEQLSESVFLCRDLVNEPGSSLTASLFASIIKEESEKAGIKTEIFGKSRLKSLKMNGLLAVNRGSINDPEFIIMEWKPKAAKNKKPYVLVGKGVMFDTGGMSLKPSEAMEAMKSDMAGAAAVFSCIRALALNNINVHVVGLIPATDNIPGQQALVPGDIISMANGKTVEVLNTDAEGRLILADALNYASKYKPELVIDVATLTGSAFVSVGKYGIVGMHDKANEEMEKLKHSGFNVYERIVELPLWDDYDKEIESDVADIKNIGQGRAAGAITAGSFLKHFVSYPWIHLDIASMGFMDSSEGYFGKGASAVGVRLLYNFFKNKA